MKIKNIRGLSATDLQTEVEKGSRFIFYPYTISFLFVTFKRTSGVYLVRRTDNHVLRSLPFTAISMLFGWWGITFGPKYTLQSINTNLKGGKNVTDDVMSTVAGFVQYREAERNKK